MNDTTTAATSADEFASGISEGEFPFTVARYGTLVVTVVGSSSDDDQFADEETASREFAEIVQVLRGPLSA